MKKIYIALLVVMSCSFIMSGCSKGEDYDVAGAWELVELTNKQTNEEIEFDSEVLHLRPDNTGAEIYLPCDAYEKYSYIVWKMGSTGNTIEIKHSEDYKYDLDIVSVTDSEMEISFFYANDESTIYSARYKKLDDGAFDYVGCWVFSDYIQDGEHFDTDESYLYLYPDGKMEEVYYEVEELVTQTGTWDKTSSYFMLIFDGYEPMRYENSLYPNRLEIYDTNEEGAEITYVYKRYYGIITNTPPAAYPESFSERISRYFTILFE